MRSSSILVTVLFIAFALAGILPRLNRVEATPAEVLPSTSVTPEAATAIRGEVESAVAAAFPGLNDFALAQLNGQPGDVVGVYVPGAFALPVMQQPKDQPAFVTSDGNRLTQFGLPKQYGTVALLAHNYLSGSQFYDLQYDQDIVVVYGDGRIEQYRIDRIEQFQALSPNSPYSQFIDLSDPHGKVLSSANLFNRIYTSAGQLVFQTCIDNDGEPSWGRLFITATRVDPALAGLPLQVEFVSDN